MWYHVPEISLRDHRFLVPLDYGSPDGSKISLFAREVVSVGKEEAELPYLLFLQGGPGFEAPRPLDCSGWLKRACEDYRVVLLDQRGTGLSTCLTVSSLSQFSTPEDQATFLEHFRADNIVRDAEFIRRSIVPNAAPWTVLGQSYGGFCAVTYLSMATEGLHQVLLTGGLPPLDPGCTAGTVYRACYKRVQIQTMKFYKRFPQDEETVRQVILHLADAKDGGVLLPSGTLLTPRMFQLLGLSLGSHTGFESLHYMLERAWDPVLVPGGKRNLSYKFLRMFEEWLDFDKNPLYAIMHESIYCQGAASRWAAHKIREEELQDQFDAVSTAKNSQPVLFTGEMVFPWMFDEIKGLEPVKKAALLLANKEDWPPLYNLEKLGKNKVPVAAAVYYEDMYVNVEISEASAASIRGIRTWVTNEYMHSGIREDGYKVVDYLLGLLKGKRPLR